MTQLVDAATLADRLGFTRDYVYRHAAELGALRFGDGPRARLRFDLEHVLTILSSTPASTAARAQPRPTPRRRTAGTVPLLEVKGRP